LKTRFTKKYIPNENKSGSAPKKRLQYGLPL